MHLYEESEQGLNIWSRDALVYNMEKFKMDTKLIDIDFDESNGHKLAIINRESTVKLLREDVT